MSSEISSRMSPMSRSGPNGSWLPSHCSYRDCTAALRGPEFPGARPGGVLREALGEVQALQGELQGGGSRLAALLGEVEALHDPPQARHPAELRQEGLGPHDVRRLDRQALLEELLQRGEVLCAEAAPVDVHERALQRLLQDPFLPALLQGLELDAAHRSPDGSPEVDG